MQAPVDHMNTLACATGALGIIKALGAPGDPRNFAAWFAYATNCSPSLNAAVDEAVARSGSISAAEIEHIFGYAPANLISGQVDDLGGDVVGEIDQVMAAVDKAADSIASFRDKLAHAARELDGIEDRSRVFAIVDGLLRATRSFEVRSNAFAASLDAARQEVGRVRAKIESLRAGALTDALTRLANRQSFERELERCIAQSESSKSALCLLLMDIDHLKTINESFGHLAGDEVIRVVSYSLKQHVQPHDVAARVGGEEFAVLLPKIQPRSALTVADHVRCRVMAMQFMKRSTGENMGRVTLSGGIARYRPGETPWAFMQRADACLSAAKRHGRNRVICDGDALVAA